MDAPPIGPFGPGEPAEGVVRPRRRMRSGVTQAAGLLVGLALGLTLPRIDGGPRVSASRTIEEAQGGTLNRGSGSRSVAGLPRHQLAR